MKTKVVLLIIAISLFLAGFLVAWMNYYEISGLFYREEPETEKTVFDLYYNSKLICDGEICFAMIDDPKSEDCFDRFCIRYHLNDREEIITLSEENKAELIRQEAYRE